MHFEQAFEQGNGGGFILGGNVELRALDHSNQIGRLDAQATSGALADAVERVAARLHDAVDGPAALLERGKFKRRLRPHAHGGRALAQLERAIAAGSYGGGQFEHGAGAHRRGRAVHGDVHFALDAVDDDVAAVDGERRGGRA